MLSRLWAHVVQAGVADAAVKLRADGLRAQAERVRGVGQATRTAEDAEAELLRLRGKQSVGARLGEAWLTLTDFSTGSTKAGNATGGNGVDESLNGHDDLISHLRYPGRWSCAFTP